MRLLTIFTSLIVLVSCSSMKPKDKLNQAPPAVAQELEKANQYYNQKKFNDTIKICNNIIKLYRNTEAGDDALYLLAKTYSRTEDWPRALQVYEEVYNSAYFSPREFDARVATARILTYKQAKYKEALEFIDQSLRMEPDREQESELLEVRFTALMKTGSQLEAFETLVSLSEKHPVVTKRDSFKQKARAFLDSRLSGSELKDFANDSSASDLKTDAMYRYGVHLMGEGRYSEAQSYLRRVVDSGANSHLSTQAKQLMDQMNERGKVNQRTIGVVLPLSGHYASIGYQTLWGLQLALGIKGGHNTENVRLAVIDSRGNPEYARRGVKRLVEENHAIAIVGGLLSKDAYSAAIQAQELGVPFIALSQKEGLTEIGPFIFRNALTIEPQLDVLIDTAMSKLKFKRFAILYPNDEYGVKISNIFWKKVREKGGTVAGAQSYLAGETDFQEPVQKLIGTFYVDDRKEEYSKRLKEWYEKQPKNARERKKPPVGILPPVVDFDALFIPDGPKAIGQIAPTLAYNDVTNVYLIGTNIWNTNEFLRRGQNFVSHSLFTDGFYEKGDEFTKSPFFKTYSETFSKAPTSFSLQGYDSGLVIRSVLAQGASSRLEFSKYIQQNQGIPGALTTLMLNNKKEFVRPIVTLTVKEGEIVPFTR